ncbi:methyltransferase, FxLD system [Sinosporangium siamense]|uniref:methyltransferase, FxLD system n=1 Tax=Sinosporangium siamense TaxID=1367973 RepID=UPI00194F589D|nr:methyltransferase, FxLD system [Sinosporangium siamense]
MRQALIAKLRELGAIRTEPVAAAFATVWRHEFVPEVPLEQVYEPENAQVTKRDQDGVALSSISAARIQALMLEQADIRPGMRVLEIGSGGLNAALIAEMVGHDGAVTSIDIDADVIDRAERLLQATGYRRVNVVLADGENGEPNHAPYDRIIVTAGAADLAPAWQNQLAEDGRLVVPLRVQGLTRSIGFEREGRHLIGRDYHTCGFVPMQGTGECRERLLVLHDGEGVQVGLRVDDDRQIDAQRLGAALREPASEAWSGMTLEKGMPYDDLDLWLATSLPTFALLATTRRARDSGLVASWSPMGVAAIIEGDSFAYLTYRATSPERTAFEFGALGHGPDGVKAADRLAEQMRVWNSDLRDIRAVFRAFPLGTPEDQFPEGKVVNRRNFRHVISWPH